MSYAIRRIIGDLHVSASDRDVIRHLRARMTPAQRRNPDPLVRRARREAYRIAIREHARNRALYLEVMCGPTAPRPSARVRVMVER